MRTEYKRDMNHNYLILYGENEINTDSYQVRMLVGNIIPSLLKCRIQGMDGHFLVYFDITSKQALNVLYEEKKMGIKDLRLIFGGFVKAMEDAAEYLMNPGQFVMSPECIYTDIEKGQIYFCMMPGYEKDIKEQFQMLTEYILPKIDHQDGEAVILGYGVYKRAMEDSFHLEHIKEELYKTQGQTDRAVSEEPQTEKKFQRSEAEWDNTEQSRQFRESSEQKNAEEFLRDEEPPKPSNLLKKAGILVLTAVALCAIAAATLLGYLPYMETGIILGSIVILAGAIMLLSRIIKVRKTSTVLPQKYSEKLSEPFSCMSENIAENWETKMYENLKETSDEQKDSRTFQTTADYGETTVLSAGAVSGPASLVSKEPGELATIYLSEELTVIGKLETACDAVISLPTVSRIHAKIRKKEDSYYLTDMNSRNGTAVNGRLLLPDEEYRLEPEDEVNFAQARYIFLA